MLYLLKKQLCLIENNLLFKITLKLLVLGVKYFIDILIFLLAARKFNCQTEESWKRTVFYLNNFFKASTLRIRFINSDFPSTPVKQYISDELDRDCIKKVLISTCESGYRSKSETDESADSSICYQEQSPLTLSNIRSKTIADVRNMSIAQFKLQSTLVSNSKAHKQKYMAKRLQTYYKNNLFKVNFLFLIVTSLYN